MTTGKAGKSFLILIPAATVFISSFCIMALELVAGRIVARQLGSSLYTWTSVIGVILAGITIGNYAGGRIADKYPAKNALAGLFALCSGSCVLTIAANNTVSDWILLWQLSWPVRTFCHVSIVFLIPSTLLGTIGPVVAKMALEQGLPAGRTIGDIYAWGAAGSIAGTFAAGFYLIAATGTIPIIWMLAAALLLMAVLYRPRFSPVHLWGAIFVFILILGLAPIQWCRTAGAALKLREKPDPAILYQAESQYSYIAVKQVSKNPDKRLFLQDQLIHSTIIMGDINDLQYPYTKIYAAITRAMSKNKKTLNVMAIGGGGYVFPRYIEHNWPGSRMDVAEIDPAVTNAAVEAFGLDRNSSIRTWSMDARNYVDELLTKKRNGGQTPKYDFIYEDALNNYSVPYQLVTREFNDKIAELLADDGAYMIELMDVYNRGRFLGAVVNTLQETFPHVYVATNYVTHPAVHETFIVTAAKQPLDTNSIPGERGFRIWHLSASEIEYLKQKAAGIVVSDDFAPVDNLLAPVVRQSAREMLALRYLHQAGSLQRQQKWTESIELYEKALQLNPSMSIKAYNEIGMMQAAQNRLQEAIQAFQDAIDYHTRTGAKEKAIGSIHLNLGTLLDGMGKRDDARQHLTRAAEEFRLELEENPNSAPVWSRLGDALAAMGDFKSASDALAKAVALEPYNTEYYYSLARTLELQGRLDDAIEVLKKGLDWASRQGQGEAVAALNEYLRSLAQNRPRKTP